MRAYVCPQCGAALHDRSLRIGQVRIPGFSRLVCDGCGFAVSVGSKLLVVLGVIGLAAVGVFVLAGLLLIALLVAIPTLIVVGIRLWLLKRRLGKVGRDTRIIDVTIVEDNEPQRKLR